MSVVGHWSFALSSLMQIAMVMICIITLIRVHTYSEPRAPTLLTDIIAVEVGVQFVEMAFYLFIFLHRSSLTPQRILELRYGDWLITTQIMLISAMALFRYTRGTGSGSLVDLIMTQFWSIARMLVANTMMMMAGLMYTKGDLSLSVSQTMGFLFLFWAFYELYHMSSGSWMVWPMLGVWALYGIAVFFPPIRRNQIYNVLDIFSKNVVGVYAASLGQTLLSKQEAALDAAKARIAIRGAAGNVIREAAMKAYVDAAEDDELVKEVIIENPQEAGARDEWKKQTGWGRRECVKLSCTKAELQ